MDYNRALKCGIDMIYLASVSLHRADPDKEKILDMDLHAVYKMAKFHSMQAIAYRGIERAVKKHGADIVEQEIYSRMKLSYGKVVKKLVGFDFEREALFAYLEAKGAWYLPLKGIHLQYFYPKIGMRQMVDNDILVEAKYHREVRRFFVDRGYSVVSYGKGCHDVYAKGNLEFEIHRILMPERNKAIFSFCEAAVSRAEYIEGTRERAFTDEDFYIYFLCHMYKHYSGGGCGIRSLMDIYVYNKKKDSTLDREYIEARLRELDLFDFEVMARDLSSQLFSCDPSELHDLLSSMTEKERDRLFYFIDSGTFGTKSREVQNRLDKLAADKRITPRVKFKYLMRRIFPSFSHYKAAHPVLYKFIITIPFLWFFRLLRILASPHTISEELKNIRKAQ